jgi:Uma2 family endonuclease
MSIIKPPAHRWTQEELHKILDLECFFESRFELIDGELLERVRRSELEFISIALVKEVLRIVFGSNFWARQYAPLDFGCFSEPVPDLAVVPGTPRQCLTTPTTALLVVEISQSTMTYYRGYKSSLYASNGITDYWIVNLVDRQLEVHRDPVADATQPFGFSYLGRTIHDASDVVAPLAAPNAMVAVADLLP